MTRAQFRFERALTRYAGALALVAACGGPQKAGGAGATCFRDDDCEAGLICVAPMDSTARVCSNDPTPLVSNVEGPPPMETGGTAGTGGVAGTAGMDAGGEPAETGGTAGTAGGGATSGSGGSDAAGTGGSSAGTAGGGAGGTAGTAGSGGGGTGGTAPEGGAPG